MLRIILSLMMLSFSLQAQQCDECCDFGRFWMGAEFLFWKINHSKEPVPLVVEGPVVPEFAPVLGQPDTSVILGGRGIHNQIRPGERFTVGCWFGDDCCYGLEANYFFLGRKSSHHSVFSDGQQDSQFFSVPFFDVTTGLESGVAISRPGSFSGKAVLRVRNSMQGAEFNGLAGLCRFCSVGCVGIVGFRYWNFNETLTFRTDSPFITNPDIFKTRDRFGVKNSFYGGQLGLDLKFVCGCFSVDVEGKVAVGGMCERLNIRGSFLTNDFDNFGEPMQFLGGYFALPSNIGCSKRTQFAVLPEGSANLCFQLIDCLGVRIGYSFLYVSKMLYAGRQLDRAINPTQSSALETTANPLVQGELLPRRAFRGDNLWVQGLNAGIELNF